MSNTQGVMSTPSELEAGMSSGPRKSRSLESDLGSLDGQGYQYSRRNSKRDSRHSSMGNRSRDSKRFSTLTGTTYASSEACTPSCEPKGEFSSDKEADVSQRAISTSALSNEAESSVAPPCRLNPPMRRPSPEELQAGKRKMTRTKYMFMVFLVGLNFIFIFATWWWSKYYYIYLPFIALSLALNCVMVASIMVFTVYYFFRPEKPVIPHTPEAMLLLMPCYNENLDECTRSLDSLAEQTGLDGHPRGIFVICDGRVRGAGMDKTTADYLAEDIFKGHVDRRMIKGAYTAWDGQAMDVEVLHGTYKGVPFFCVNKQLNQGKRDSLIVIRSFLHKFNKRSQDPDSVNLGVFSTAFFDTMSSWITSALGVSHVELLVGLDADTVFDKDCVWQLLKTSRLPGTVGVCGYVTVNFKGHHKFSPWLLYQSTEYTIAQCLRRLHQSVATKKVSCLPGCCQVLRVCEETCGDDVLLHRFGYHPRPTDGMLAQIRATASEDRNHVCLVLVNSPKVKTRQALWARAYTDVPTSWSVFLSQRRRWTLGATANDLMLTFALRTQWWERLLALSNVLMWVLNVFVIACLGSMILAFIRQPFYIILAFVGVMIVPLIWYVGVAIWMPRTWLERAQYLVGLCMFVVGGPIVNISVLLFAVWNMDSFGWGKTRKVVEDNPETGNNTNRGTWGLEQSADAHGEWVAPPMTTTVAAPPRLFLNPSRRQPVDDVEKQLA